MNFYHETIKNAPPTISISEELQNRSVEIIILSLDEKNGNVNSVEVDENGYPIGFFERPFGSIPDFPEREPQGEFEQREEFEDWES